MQWKMNLITPTGASKLHASWDTFALGESVGVGVEAEVLPQLLVVRAHSLELNVSSVLYFPRRDKYPKFQI